MMDTSSGSIKALLRACWLRGITLTLKDGKLSFKADVKGVMDQALLSDIRRHKGDIIEALQSQPDYFAPRPLSLNERALWFLYRMTPDSAAYNMAYAVKLSRCVTVEAVEQAFSTLLARYPILSQPYGERDGDPVQWSAPSIKAFEQDYDSVSTVSVLPLVKGTDKQIKGWIAREADKPLKLDEGQVCRAALLVNRQGAEEHLYLTLVIHHIAADFMSFEVLRSELLQLLRGERIEVEKAMPDYRQWSARQRQAVREGARSEAFWQETLHGLPQLSLPTDFPHHANVGAEGEEIAFTLPESMTSQLRLQCRHLEVTPYVWWMAAFQWFMARLSGQDDFIIGTPSSGRLTPNDARMVGYLVNPLALRVKPNAHQAFSDWVAQVEQHTQHAMSHQAYPFSALVETLKVQREAGRSPIFQHMFTLNHERPETGKQALIEQELLAEQRGAAHELNLVVVDNRHDFIGKWRYNKGLYRRSTVESIRDSFVYCVEQLLDDQTQTLNHLELARPETASMLSGDVVSPLAPTAWRAFVENGERYPERTALQMGELTLTYAELSKKIEITAAVLRANKVQQNSRVGVCLDRSIEQVVAIFAIWRLGATYVAMDPKWPKSRLEYICDDANLSVLISDIAQGELNWLTERCSALDVSQLVSLVEAEAIGKKEKELVGVHGPDVDHTAYVIYTSGSTGNPKGVEVSQTNLIHYVTGVMDRLQLPEDASLATLASNGADLGYTALFGALLSGRTLRLLPEELAFDAEALADELAVRPIDCLKIVPSHLNGILLATPRTEWLPRLALVTGGEAISMALLRNVFERQPALSVFNHYGPTETTVGVIAKKLDLYDDEIALGKPMANVQTRVVDVAGRVVPQGFAGELEVAGATVAKGYLDQPNLTAERFYQDCFSQDDKQGDSPRWYRTGDRVKQVGEQLYFIGRNDFQIKVRGYRVEPGEVESWLKQHVADAVVLNCPDERQNNRLVAYLVVAYSAEEQPEGDLLEGLKTHMLEALPDYMVPAVWIPLAALPLLGNGKLDRSALQNPDVYLQEKAANSVTAFSESDALSESEAVLLDIWQALLGKPELGVHDNFFANGGDSILGLQIIAKAKQADIVLTPKAIFEHQTVAELAKVAERVNAPKKQENTLENALLDIAKEVLGKPDLKASDNFFAVGGDSILSLQIISKAKVAGIALTPKQVFEHQTMAELASAVASDHPQNDVGSEAYEAGSESDDIKSAPSHCIAEELDAFELTPIQSWFFEQQEASDIGNLGHWNQSLLLNSDVELAVSDLRKAALALVEHHPSLRLSFAQKDGVWKQKYQPIEADWGNQLVVEYCGDEVTRDSLNDTLLTHLQSDFRLDRAPLIKFVWLTESKQLLCAAHHLIVDAVSWHVLLQDLYAYYLAFQNGEEVASSAPSSAARFDEWQTYLAHRAEALDIDAARAYWSAQVDADVPQTSASDTYENSTQVQICLPVALTETLLGEANRAYNTRVQELLITALAKVLGQWQQLPDITIELEGHGREAGDSRLDVSSSIGWFTSRFPQKLSAVSDWATALIYNKEQLRRLPEKGMEYGLLRYLSSVQEDQGPSQSFLPHRFVSFNYLGQRGIESRESGDLNVTSLRLATPVCPGMKAANAQRPHVLDINAMVLSGVLHMEWTYPARDERFACIPTIAAQYVTQLTSLIEHCCDPNYGRATAVDFPDAELTDSEFIDLLAELEA
ncbi:non-ribosomal peptide synthetase [Marinomonas mediterranea]|uniref:non-ribosomal peptide synthetase n=1 Tax=Marinomonas mediterranea TaxID=119864 RepID=UPI0023498D5C|nr:non-ribosomal peptide synthetase [Marinomonas mediterranea]WCN08292.1 amino acid adenylation domain-containing protein [Marinomonas mediterranea]